MKPTNPQNKRNGFLAIGFASKNTKHDKFQNKYQALSEYITTNYRFKEFKIAPIDLKNVGDTHLVYTMVGLWRRKLR